MSDPGAAVFRIGCVKYLNAQPLIHGWPGPVVFDHPAALCRKLADSELDLALVSSFEFLRDPVYAIADDLAVAVNGEVYSVFVAHRGPIEEVNEIALDPASATSVNLLRCLLAERGLHPRLSSDLAGAEARLLIGDQAIEFRRQAPAWTQFWDLGTEWKRTTGLPFVFALWLIRPEVDEPGVIAGKLRALRDENLATLDKVIAAQKTFPPEFCSFYFRDCIRYNFADTQKRGLLHFRRLCEKHGIIPAKAAPLQLA
ncbi:MAG: menaquinone biosynthesis protein [Chthoniobacterales bacterium]